MLISYTSFIQKIQVTISKNFSRSMNSRIYFDHFLSTGGKVPKTSIALAVSHDPTSTKQIKGPQQEAEVEYVKGVEVWGTKGDRVTPGYVSGIDRLNNPRLNKSLAFSIEERQLLGIHGLLPPVVKNQEQQIQHCKMRVDRLSDPLDKYVYLMGLLDFNEKLLYATLRRYIVELMPIMYTPTVGLACQKWGLIYRRPRGVYITLYDRNHIYDIFKNWPERDVRVIVVTDGERILGLGDQGACGMGIPIGKLALYTALAGVNPHHCLPVTIDVGTNNELHLKDPLYPGIREKRRTGPKYDELIDEFMQAAVQTWGRTCLIQFEDFGNKNAFRLLERYREYYCTFNDDIQGTASVVVAGLLAALRITKNKLSDHVIVFQGAGEANIGVANLCVMAMVSDGVTPEAARKNIWMVDSKGLIVKSRSNLEDQKKPYAQDHKEVKQLRDVVKAVKPTILIGAAAIGGAFTPEILQEVAKNCKNPIVFALSNPTTMAECTPDQAYKETKGAVIYASGSPFPAVQYGGKTFITGQANNAYVFPGVGLAAICAGITSFSDDYFLIVAEVLASLVKESDLTKGCIYPPLTSILDSSVQIATRVVEYAYKKGQATVVPEPENKEAFLRAHMYNTAYEPSLPDSYVIAGMEKPGRILK